MNENDIIKRFVNEFCLKADLKEQELKGKITDNLLIKIRYLLVDAIYSKYQTFLSYKMISDYFERSATYAFKACIEGQDLIASRDPFALSIKDILNTIEVNYG